MTSKTVEMPLDLLNRMSALWPANVENDGSGGIGFLPHVTDTVNQFRKALAGQTARVQQASGEQPRAEEGEVGHSLMVQPLIDVEATLQRLVTFLEDTSLKRRATLNRNPSGRYVSATIAGIAPVAGRLYAEVDTARLAVCDYIMAINEGSAGPEVDVLRQRNALLEKVHREDVLKLDRLSEAENRYMYAESSEKTLLAQIKALTKVPPLYAAVERAAAELPEGWEIRIGLELGAGIVELFDEDDCEVKFATNHERMDYTVIDALEAAKTKSLGSVAAIQGEGV